MKIMDEEIIGLLGTLSCCMAIKQVQIRDNLDQEVKRRVKSSSSEVVKYYFSNLSLEEQKEYLQILQQTMRFKQSA